MRRAPVVVALLVVAALDAPHAAHADASSVQGPTRSVSWAARIVAPTNAYEQPRPGPVVARLPTQARWAGGPHQLLVLATRRDRDDRLWLKVRLDSRPNDAAGWIAADRTVVKRTPWQVELDLSDRQVIVRRAGRIVRRFPAVIGAPATPTPRGLFAIAEEVRQPTPRGFLGPWALHLTAHSEVLDDYGGGPGRVAIHGRGGASLFDPLGSARSHGCVRIDNRHIRFLAGELEPGAPVRVTA